jgi:hypothetical protein
MTSKVGSVRGGRLYLASYALGLGATGLTFFDDDVVDVFSPHASRRSVVFLAAVGHPFKRRRARWVPLGRPRRLRGRHRRCGPAPGGSRDSPNEGVDITVDRQLFIRLIEVGTL